MKEETTTGAEELDFVTMGDGQHLTEEKKEFDLDEQEELEEDEDDDDEDEFEIRHLPLDHDCCSDEPNFREGILFEAAVSASNEADFISELGSKCRVELFELILKADLDKEKIKEKVRSLQEFLVASEHRSDELIARVERLLKN